jgi:triphosphatase
LVKLLKGQGRPSAHSLLRKVLAPQVERIQQCKVGVIQGAQPESIHDLRVAVRRVRVALKLCRDIVERKIDPIRDELASIGKAAGVARDSDLFADRLSASLQRLSLDTPAAELLTSSTLARCAQAHGTLSDVLRSRTYENALNQLSSLLNDERTVQEIIVGRRRIRRMGHRVCSKKLARVLRWQHQNVRKVSDEDLHQLRRDVKELRYAIEFFAEVLTRRSRDGLRITVVIQDGLGLLHDFVVAIEMLGKLSKVVPNRPVSEEDVSLVIDSLERLWRAEATQARERFFQVWHESNKRLHKLQRSLAKD